MPVSTISGILKRIGMGKLGRLGLEPAQRYERARPGELIHIDVKKLGRIQGGAGKRITGGTGNNGSVMGRDAAGVRRQAKAGTRSTSPSTMRPAWPTSRSSPTRKPPPLSLSSDEQQRSTPGTESPSNG
jgi:hypothetical protein